jgi:DNA/RNA endonuclease YhcR with UshA esterase domain
VAVEIPADAKDWLGVTSSTVGTNPTVTFYAKANEGGDRETTVTFKTTDGSKEYTSQTTITQKGAIVECSVADFLAAEVGNTQFRLTGVITKIAKAEYGNIYIKDYSGEAYVYGVGAKGDFEKLGLKEGDVITLVGKRGEYKGSAQMTGGQYEAHKTVTAVTIDEFLAKEDNPNVYYMVSGTVDEIANESYGNLYLKDGDSRLYVYGTYPGWGATGDNRKGAIAANGIEVGDKLTVIGVKSTYKGTPQVNGGIYFSHQKPE